MKPTVRFFISVLLGLSCRGYAQTFYKTFDVGAYPNVVTCTEKMDGDFLLLIESEIPYTDYFYLTDLNPAGQVVWTKRLDFPHDDVLPLQMRSNGDSTYTILMNSFHKPTFTDRGVMLLNIDGNANVRWTNTYGENTNGSYEIPFNFSRTVSGGYVIAAQRVINTNAYPALVVADSAGNFLWGKSYDPFLPTVGSFTDVNQAPGGGFIACGDAKPYAFILKTDSSGNIEWLRNYHTLNAGDVDIYSVTVTSDSCFLAYGLRTGTQGNTFLMKVDANGNTLWLTSYNFYSPYLKPFPIYEAGGTFTFLSNVAYGPNSNTTRFNVTKADANGNLIFSKLYHPSMKNVMSDMQLTNSNGLIASGYVVDTITLDQHGFFMKSFNAVTPECLMDQTSYLDHPDTFNIDSGSVSLSFTGDAVPVVVVSSDNITDHNLCGPVTIEETLNENSFTLAPDPAGATITLSFLSDVLLHDPVVVSIMDVTGRLVTKNSYRGQKNVVVDISLLPGGVYFCKVEMNGMKMAIKKIAVSK